jgi:hypothetical protein
MSKLNRDSITDAKGLIESFLPDAQIRQKFINFLSDAISFADSIKPDNWSLNLDINGKFLRFNTGQEYCVDLYQDRILILCIKKSLKQIPDINKLPILLINGNQNVEAVENIDIVPDLLKKVDNSIGCLLSSDLTLIDSIDKLKASNKDFIKLAMRTKLLPNMRQAHSKGAVDYIFSEFKENEEPLLPDLSEIIYSEALQFEKARNLSQEERLDALKVSNKKPKQTIVQQTVFLRNQFVVAEVLYRAKGICEECKQPAPFLKAKDNSPYLEVHHKIRLIDGGDDTIENAIALCPNCHRKAHYGAE